MASTSVMPVKEFIKNRPVIANIVHWMRPFTWRPSSVNVQVILKNLAERRDNLFFVQIGSNDGLNGDPIYKLIRDFRWKGIMVEPLPEICARLKSNYRGIPGLTFENSAISAKIGKTPFYTLSEVNGHNSSQVSSLLFEVIAKQKLLMPDFAERFEVRYVNSITVTDLLEKHAVSKIDLLHIDAEGYDFEILKMFDFTETQPAVILFESEHLSAEDYQACLALLKKAGYRIFFRDGLDTIALTDTEFL